MTYHDLVSASCNSLHTWANYVFIPFEIIVIKPCFSLYTDPFKFEVPSPDDVVYTGLRSSKTGLKGMLPSTNNLPLELKLEKMILIVERATNLELGMGKKRNILLNSMKRTRNSQIERAISPPRVSVSASQRLMLNLQMIPGRMKAFPLHSPIYLTH